MSLDRYFTYTKSGTINFTPLFMHNVARDLLKYSKDNIFKLDTNQEYHSESEGEFKDTWDEENHKDAYNLKYADKLAEFSKQWKDYTKNHSDEFEERYMIDIGGEDEARYFSRYVPNLQLSLQDALKLFNTATQLGEFDKKGAFGLIPSCTALYSRPEFATSHKKWKADKMKELGIPEDDYVAPKITRTRYTISKKAKEAIAKAGSYDIENLDGIAGDYINGLVEYLKQYNVDDFKDSDLMKFIKVGGFTDLAAKTKDFTVTSFEDFVHTNRLVFHSKDLDCDLITLTREPKSNYLTFSFAVETESTKSGHNLSTGYFKANYDTRIVTKLDWNDAITCVIHTLRNTPLDYLKSDLTTLAEL